MFQPRTRGHDFACESFKPRNTLASGGKLMSALGHKRTLGLVSLMSALPPKADIEAKNIGRHYCDVRFVPKAGIVRSSLAATREVLSGLVSQVVLRVDEFEAKRSDGRHLADVLTGFCPMKVVRVARQNDDAAGRIGLKLLGIEPITEADVENTGDHCVDAILGVFVRHKLYPGRNFDPDRVGPRLCWIADNGGAMHPRWKTWIRFPDDIFRKD
jgi:hypothetical protein